MLLAAIGVYGLISQGVNRRRVEIGIRIALGATPGSVLGMVLKEAAGLIAAGLALGIPMTLAATRIASVALFGVTPRDPLALAAAVALLVTVGAGAGVLPARRASAIDPIQTLRDD